MSKMSQLVFSSPLARAAMVNGLAAERKGNLAEAEVWYTVAVRNKHPQASRRLQRVQRKQVRESLTNRDIREMEQRLKESQIVEELPKIAPSISIPREDKVICVQPSVRKEGSERVRQEKERKGKKPAQPAKCSKTNTAGTTAAGSATNQEQERKKTLDEMKKKAKDGDPDSMYGLGMYYVNKGIKWLKMAAKKKHQQAKVQLNRWKNEAGDEAQERECPDPAEKTAVAVLTYEQIMEQVERLQPFFQYRLAKYCLDSASERGHQQAKKLIEIWDAECEPRGGSTYYARSEETTWGFNVAEAPETRNGAAEEMRMAWVHTADVSQPEDGTDETATEAIDAVPGCQIWERDVLPLGSCYTDESGHEVVADTISHSVPTVSAVVEEKRGWLAWWAEKWKTWMRRK